MRRNWITILPLVLLIGIINNSIAEEVKKITYTGRVVDYNARPVEGATVVCYKFSHGQNQNSYDPVERVQTTPDGRFSIQVEKENSHPLLVAGKQDLALGWRQIYNVSEPIIRLGRPSQFKGTVVDEVGHPVPGARVRICLKNEMMAREEIAPLLPEIWFTSKTNTRGQFLFDNVPKGTTADFGVETPGKASLWTICDFGPRQGEQFTAGCTDIRIVLPPEACIKGWVVDETTGEPVAGVPVLAMPYSRVGWDFCQDPVQTDPNGQFELTGLAPNKYLLRVNSDKAGSGHLSVTVNSGQAIRDIKIPLIKGIPFEVKVYDQEKGYPVEDAYVTVTQEEATSRYTTFRQQVTTDTNGLARLFVPPGECEIQAFKVGYGAMYGTQRLQVKQGQTLRHEISSTSTACILSGEVLDEQGHMLSDALAMLLPHGLGFHTLTDANGLFEFTYYMARVPSKQQVLVRHTSSGLAASAVLRYPNKSFKLRSRITLKPAYELRGRVTDPNGRNIPAAYVKLLQRRYRNLFTEVATDANGVYSIHSVPPPEGNDLQYAIAACAEGFGLNQVSQISFHDDTAKPVHIDPIVLLPANEVISGVVQDSNDQPVACVLIQVYGPRFSSTVSQPPYGKTLTDTQGRFRITGVCKEPLRIYAKSSSDQQQPGETWAYGGNENVRVVLGQKLIFSSSLTGKPLPDLKDLKVDFSPADTDDKMMLVCFFDMEQRPSRNCIIQLAKKAEELKAKDIIVIAVQSSRIDENKLNEWVKKYNIPFNIGMIQSDVEKTRFTWSVKALPWLILTDKEHIVRAEGFTISELSEKLKQIDGD
ncbi:MAG: redoxin domain-containing protein [Planctomycetes bacterium]|nr:redoxin domain-containing protein [Planctomycetota bacterium]